jgi:hypothetical protein
VRVVTDGLPRVDPREDARLAAGSEALYHRVINLKTKSTPHGLVRPLYVGLITAEM